MCQDIMYSLLVTFICAHILCSTSLNVSKIQFQLFYLFSIVSTSKGNKILTKEEFKTLECDGKIDTVYGTRMKQGGGEMKDYNDITYILKD